MADETISEKCETLYNKLNTFVASVISRDVTPKISNLNTEVWGSDTQTGNSRIDTLNTNFNNLDNSITTMESDVSNLQTSVNSLSTSIANHLEDFTWINFYNYDGIQLWTNKALKLSYLQFNKNVSVGASSTTTMKNDYSSTDEKIPYCPPTSTYCSTSIKDVYLTVNYLGGIKIINKGSALSNQSLQGMMVFKAKG